MLTGYLSFFIYLMTIYGPSYGQTLPRPLVKNQTRAIATLDHFSTSANFKPEGGSYRALPNGGSYSSTLINLKGSHDMDNQWRLLSGLTLARATSDNGTTTREGTDISELTGEAQYWLIKKPFWFVPEVKFSYPLQRVSDSTQDIITNEGAMTLQVGAWAAKKFGPARGHAYLGLKYQDEGRATLLPWLAAGEYRPKLWFINGGFRGFETLLKSNDSRASHEAVVSRVNGGSLKYYPVNPSLREVFAEAGMHTKTWQAWLGLAQGLNGAEYAQGFTATVGGLFNLDWGGGGSSDAIDEEPVFDKPKKKEFDMGRETYDEKIFRESSPVDPADELDAPVPTERRQVKKKKRKIKKGPSTDKMLDDAEKKLEQGL